MESNTNQFIQDIVKLDRDSVLGAAQKRIESSENPLTILEDARRGMSIVGEKFQSGEYYLSELILSAEIFKKILSKIEPHFDKSALNQGAMGKIVLATLRGDIHDIGKNVFASVMKGHNFDVHDLGVDVDPQVFVAKVKEIKPEFVGFSCLLTTAFDEIKKTVSMLEAEGLRDQVKVMIGGGVTTADLIDYIGVDFQTIDATAGLEYCININPAIK